LTLGGLAATPPRKDHAGRVLAKQFVEMPHVYKVAGQIGIAFGVPNIEWIFPQAPLA
jgi:hypothetical protein